MRIVILVCSQGRTWLVGHPLDHGVSRLAFRGACGLSDFDVDYQTVMILHQGMVEEDQLRFVALALFVQTGIRIGGRGVGFVDALLTLEVYRGITTAIFRWRSRTVFLNEAFMRSSGLNQRTVDREMLVEE